MTNMPPFTTPAVLTSLSMTADGGLRMSFVTNELSDEDKLIATKYHQKFGYMAFSPNQFSLEDMPKEQAEDKHKTPSKRLRASLFVLYKQEGVTEDFEVWYRRKMEKLIDYIKGKLEPEV